MSLADQEDLIKKSQKVVKASKVCGMNQIDIYGFMPQSFDQNEDTYEAIDDQELVYDAGFQAGLIFLPGFEDEVWPYPVEGHNFYAVPLSTYEYQGKKMPIYDREMKDAGVSASQSYEILVDELDRLSSRNEPMVILLSISISGSGDYADSLKDFLKYASSKNTTFVNTIDLVNKSKTGTLSISRPNKAICTTCGQDESIDVSISEVQNESNATNLTNNAQAVV